MIKYIPLLITLITVISGFITWGFNEKSKRKQESYKRREERYADLIKSIKGFYVNSDNPCLKDNFLEQVDLCWMYCPDNVVKRLYAFLETVKESSSTGVQKQTALGEVMVAIRKDLLKDSKIKSNLTSDQFKIYSVNSTVTTKLKSTDSAK
ncbi:hypothetical protein EWI07_14510 [Sporolactobacillus sp. THM7-4]|nr:hypothetical protein EWI07_14510 [Sporolactobacillus sp. THM7-4]